MSVDAAKEKILREVDLREVIGQTVALTRRSGNHVGLCPFHEEKSPSFTVFAKNYYCFGCQASGDVITFVMQTKGLGFIDALKYLAASNGIDVGELRRKNTAEDQARAIMFRCLQKAQEYFTHHIASAAAKDHRDYLVGRGFSPEQITAYGFGFAPEGGGLTSALLGQGIKIGDIEKASLGYPAKYPKPGQQGYDFFQSRITIPIKDSFGRIVGFGGRTVVDHPAKYKNSKETDLFQKSRLLFGADVAVTPARKNNRIIVTEGYMDAMQLWANGIGEAVAILGTALTQSHMRSLARLAKRVYLVFDGDKAGVRAGLKSVEAALAVPGLNIKVLSLPDGQDPDSYVAAHGKDAFIDALGSSEDLFQFAIRHTLKGQDGLQVTQVVTETILPWLKTIADPITRSYLLTKLAQTTGINQGTLESQMDRVSRPAVPKQNPPPGAGRRPVATEAVPQPPARAAAQPQPFTSQGRDFAGPHDHDPRQGGQVAEPARPSTSQLDLDKVAVELLAHLYFMPQGFMPQGTSPQDSSPQEGGGRDTLAEAVELVLAPHAEAHALAMRMTSHRSALGDGSSCLADTDGSSWLSGDPEAWLPFFARLKERREFFETEDPQGALDKIISQARLTKIKKDISMLKAQLAANPSSLEILATLGQLTSQRIQLEKNLT